MYSDEIGHVTIYVEEEFEDTKEAIRIHITKNIRTWKRVQWSDESLFLLRRRKTAFHERNVMDTTAFGGGGVALWGAFPLIVS